MIEHSEEIGDLATALIEARKQMESATKGTKAHYGKYADLNTFIDASNPHLLDADLILTQHPISEYVPSESTQVPPTALIGCSTLLIHGSSGQWLRSSYMMPCASLSPQDAGGVLTYSRRYTIQAVLNLPAKDDDAQQAQNNSRSATATPITAKTVTAGKTSAQLAEELADDRPTTDYNRIRKMIAAVTSVKPLTAIYKTHIENNTTLNENSTSELLKLCTEKREQLEKEAKNG